MLDRVETIHEPIYSVTISLVLLFAVARMLVGLFGVARDVRRLLLYSPQINKEGVEAQQQQPQERWEEMEAHQKD